MRIMGLKVVMGDEVAPMCEKFLGRFQVVPYPTSVVYTPQHEPQIAQTGGFYLL